MLNLRTSTRAVVDADINPHQITEDSKSILDKLLSTTCNYRHLDKFNLDFYD